MKRILSILLCGVLLCAGLPALAQGAAFLPKEYVPQEVLSFFSAASFNGCTVGEQACVTLSTQGRAFCFAVVQKNGHNTLYGFEYKNGNYEYWLRTDSCLPQGEGTFRLSAEYGEHDFLEGRFTFYDAVNILFTRAENEEQGDTGLIFECGQNGQWQLRLLHYDALWRGAVIKQDSIAYYDEGEYLGTAYGVVETNLRYFSLSAFPRTLREARDKLTAPPSIPSGELKAQRIKFTGGQKYEVYTGPGANYLRAAGGKASVSTNDWIQVFGSENGYILIQYDISSSQNRFGYIPQSALPKSASVSPLNFNASDARITASCALTDDPLNSQSALAYLSAGDTVKWLAIMGNWVYVEAYGQNARGFVPAGSISRTAWTETYSASFKSSEYAAQASLELTGRISASLSVTVDGPAAWSESGADRVTGYQLYANNVPVYAQSSSFQNNYASSWQAVFTLTASLPAGTGVLALCPIREISGSKTNEMILFHLNETK